MAEKSALDTTTGGFFVTIATPKGSTTKRIEGDMLSVGRGEDCNLTIQHETLSRRHMSVQLKAGQCWVEDHGSSNGTFVNGKRLKAHQPVRVLPEDFIQLGQSGVRLSVSVEAQMWKSATPPIPGETKADADNTIVTTTVNERRLARANTQPNIDTRPDTRAADATDQAEKLLQEAQKKAAKLIQEAEVDAERRVEDIYRRAHATQAKMDEAYQKRLNEAYRSAESVFQKSQAESESILDEARAKSAEIRAQAEGFVMELRRRTEEDCERILDEAQVTARELKEGRLAEAEEMIRRKEDELARTTREAMSTRLARFEEDLLKEAERQREVLESELNDRRLQLDLDQKEQIESLQNLKKEVSHLAEMRDREAVKLRDLEGATEKHQERLAGLKSQIDESKKSLAASNLEVQSIKAEIEAQVKNREASRVAAEKVRITQEDLDDQLLKIRAKFEETKNKWQDDEQAHLEQLKLETTRRIAALEQQLVEELLAKKERLEREIGLLIDTHLKESPDHTPKSMRALQDKIGELMTAQIATLSKDPAAKEKQMSLVRLKSRERYKAVGMGLTLGVLLSFGALKGYRQIQAEISPMQRRVLAAQEERKADLERRKFDPPQTKELRATYVDSVIYTEGFVVKYQREEFQKKLLAAATPFLLKTWRVDEEKVIQLLAATNSLVKSLADRRQAIHPDYIPQGLEKMKELEDEALQRMRQILGSQVRVESYRKFEKKFYEDHAG